MSEAIAPGASAKRFAFNSAAAFLVYTIGIGLAFLSQLLLARVLGAEMYGIYAYVLAWISVLAYFSTLGFQVGLLRFVSMYMASQAWALLRGVIRYAEFRVALISTLLLVLGTVGVILRGPELTVDLKNTFLFGFMLIPLWAFTWIRCSVVRAFGGVVSALVPVRIVREGLLLAFVGFAVFGLQWHVDAPLVLGATVICSIAAVVFATAAMHRLRPSMIADVVPKYETRIWRQAAFPLLIVAAAEVLFDRMGVLVLGWIAETEAAGVYALIFNMSLLVVLPRTAINTSFAPEISRLHAQNKYAELQALTTRAAVLSLTAAVCIALFIAVLAEPVLSWFGEKFVHGAFPLRILLIGQLFAAGAGSQLQIMAMTGNGRAAANVLLLSVVVSAVICAILVSLMGLTGAAISTTVALIFWNVAMALSVWWCLQLRPGVFAAASFLRIWPAACRTA